MSSGTSVRRHLDTFRTSSISRLPIESWGRTSPAFSDKSSFLSLRRVQNVSGRSVRRHLDTFRTSSIFRLPIEFGKSSSVLPDIFNTSSFSSCVITTGNVSKLAPLKSRRLSIVNLTNETGSVCVFNVPLLRESPFISGNRALSNPSTSS